MPRITVVLPFYNAEQTLHRAIESIAQQTFVDFECLLINNNSTDGGVRIAQDWAAKDCRFLLLHETEQGVMYASNCGAEKARGEFIARMDADDWAFPNRLELSVNYLDLNAKADAVAGLVEYMPHHENTKGFADYVDWSNTIQTYEQIKLKQFVEAPIINPTAMWRKSVGQQFGLYKQGDFPEDYEMWLRWLEAGVEIHKLNYKFLKWFDSDTRLTRTDDIYSDEAFFRIKSEYLYRTLKKQNLFFPYVLIWGASATSRQRLKPLVDLGIVPVAFIDVKRTRQIGSKVIYYEDLPEPGSNFILVYMKPHGIRNQISEFLTGRGYVEGKNYLFVS
jgi:glycosyltransferase involved in cell wall biosynthesis